MDAAVELLREAFAWGSGALGIIFGIAGFLNLSLHWDWLAKFLGT